MKEAVCKWGRDENKKKTPTAGAEGVSGSYAQYTLQEGQIPV